MPPAKPSPTRSSALRRRAWQSAWTAQTAAPRGLLRVQVNGIPDSLIRQLMLALARAAEQAALPQPLVKRIQAAARPGTRMDHVIDLIIQNPHVYAGPLHLALLGASSRHAQRHPSRRSAMSARSH